MLRAAVLSAYLLASSPRQVPPALPRPVDRVPLVPGFWTRTLRGLA